MNYLDYIKETMSFVTSGIKTKHIPIKVLPDCDWCEDKGFYAVQTSADDFDNEPCQHCTAWNDSYAQ